MCGAVSVCALLVTVASGARLLLSDLAATAARRGGIGDCARRYDLRLPADEVVGVLHHPGWPAGVGPSVARTLVRARELHLVLLRDFNFKIDAVVALL